MTSTWPSISILIVTYNSAPHLRTTLETVLAQDYPDYEVILVDNASRDDSLAIAREFEPRGLRVIAGTTNRGFAGGNNDGAAASRGELIFLVNPDITMPPGALYELARAFAACPEAGVIGAKLIASDGETLLHAGGLVGLPAHCSNPGRGERDNGQFQAPIECEYVQGAALALRREYWQRLGGLDESLNPAYYEDTDLCVRARRRLGLKVICWPALRLLHHENVSCEYQSPAFMRLHHRNRLWFTLKNHSLKEILFQAAPAEWRWFDSPSSKGVRRLMVRLYAEAAGRYLRWKLTGRA